jgi:hypothetical protein
MTGSVVSLLQQYVIHNSTVCGSVFKHNSSVVVDEYPEVDVAQPSVLIIDEADVTSCGVATKGEA